MKVTTMNQIDLLRDPGMANDIPKTARAIFIQNLDKKSTFCNERFRNQTLIPVPTGRYLLKMIPGYPHGGGRWGR